MIPSDRGGKKKIGGTFLGVPVSTLTPEAIKDKAAKDKAVADKRAPIVNAGIKKQNQKLLNILYYDKKAENLWHQADNSKVVSNAPEPVSTTSTVTTSIPTPTVTTSNNAYRFAGQFLGVGSEARRDYHNTLGLPQYGPSTLSQLGTIAAQRDTAKNWATMYTLNTYALDQNKHKELIEQGEKWIKDPDITHWLGLDKEFFTEADVQEYERKYKEYEDYCNRYFVTRTIYNTELSSFGDYVHIADDAPLPPWVAPTSQNIAAWEYYRSYESEVGKRLHDDAIEQVHQQALYREHPYQSAFSGEEGRIDSFADVIYSSSTPNEFWDNYKQYVKDYHLNPLLAGKFGTVLGNHLWNLMDTLDFASRGVRAFVAGDTVLGGTGYESSTEVVNFSGTGNTFLNNTLTTTRDHKTTETKDTTFKGQNVYWAHVNGYTDKQVQEAQKIFMQNGGYDLILRKHPELIKKSDYAKMSNLSEEEILNNITGRLYGDRALAEAIYKDIDDYLSGRSPFEDVKQGFANVKKAYRDPAESFEADTGSIAANMILETVLDPGLIIGSPAKGAAQEGAKRLASESIENVLTLFKNTTPEVLDSKAVRNAINAFASSNEGRNILFKNADKLKADANAITTVLVSNGAISYKDQKAFSKALTNALTGSQFKHNGAVIGSQFFDELNKTRKLYRTAAWIDRGIDTVDTAIIKGSFIEPIVAAKALKKVNLTVKQMRLVRNIINENALKNAEAARTITKDLRSTGIVGSLEELAEKRHNNIITKQAYTEQANVIKLRFKSASQSIEYTYNQLANGSLTSRQALEEISAVLQNITGTGDATIENLASIVANSSVKGELDDVFHSLNRTYSEFMDLVDNIDSSARHQFLNEVSKVTSVDELSELILRYSDQISIHDLRLNILDRIPNNSIVTETQLDELLDDLSTGLLAERSATIEGVKNAAGAIKTASNKVKGRWVSVPEIYDILDHIDTTYRQAGTGYKSVLKDALKNGDASVSKINKILNSFHANNNNIANDSIIKAIDESLVPLIEKKAAASLDEITAAEWRATTGEQLIAELEILKKQIGDALEISGYDSILVFHLDKQAKYDTVINDRSFSNLFDRLYDQTIKPAVDVLRSKVPLGSDAYEKVPVYQALMRMSELRYSYDRYRRFTYALKSLGISDEANYAIRNGLFGNYGESAAKLIDVTRRPGGVRSYIESTLYNEFGASQVGMESLMTRLRTIDSFDPDPVLKDYVDQINASPELREWFDNIIKGDLADPEVYIKAQMLSTILMDPKAIERFNSYEHAPIFLHISTTGFGDQAAITGISYKKWSHVELTKEGKIDISSVKKMFDESESYNIKRVMSDDEIAKLDDSFLYDIYNNSIGGRSSRPEKLREKYKAIYGVTDEHPDLVSESDILEDFFNSIYKDTYSTKLKDTIIPSFVVHDLEGFNIPYINRRASLYTDLGTSIRTTDYLNRVASRAESNAINTFDELRKLVNDSMLSSEEFDKIEKYINDLAQDLSENTSGEFNMLDIMDFPNEVRTVLDAVNGVNASETDDEVMSLLMENIDPKATDQMLIDAYESMTEIAALDDEAKQIAAISGMDRPRPLSGVKFDEAELEQHFGEKVNSALTRITDKLGLTLRFGAIDEEMRAAGYYTRRASGDYIQLDTSWKQNLREVFTHEFRHNLSDAGRRGQPSAKFGAQFNLDILNRLDKAAVADDGTLSDIATDYITLKMYQYPQFASEANVEDFADEITAPIFQFYMSSPDVIDDVRQLLINKGLMDTPEGAEALEILEDIKTIFNGNFELDNYANARHLEVNDYVGSLEKQLLNNFCSKAEVKEEFLNSLINAVLDKDRFKREFAEAVMTQNPVKNAASVTGERIINVADKYHLNSIRKYFPGVGTFDDGIVISFENIKRMSDISKWIDKKIKYSVRLGAEEFLQSYKPGLDRMIKAVKNLAEQSASKNMLGYVDSFAYLQYIDTPRTATESYLLCQKLYDDLLKYWLNSNINVNYSGEIADFATGKIGHISDEYRDILFAQFINGLDFYRLGTKSNRGILSLLEGYGASNIFKDVPLTPSVASKYTPHGKVKEGISAAKRLKKAYGEMRAIFKDHEYLDAVLRASGIKKKVDFKLGFMYSHMVDLDDAMTRYIMRLDGDVNAPVLDDMFEAIGDAYSLKLHNVRFKRLLTDNEIDEGKLMSELLWNDANHIVFQRDYYSEEELNLLRARVKQMQDAGADYIKIAEDRDTFAVYLNDNCKVFTNQANNRDVRYVYKNSDGTYGTYYSKPELEHISLPEFAEFSEFHKGRTGEILDDFEEVYTLLKQCWDDIPLLSDGASRGSSGFVVFSDDIDEYYKRAKQLMPDLLSNEGLRDSGMYGHVIYDPGFMSQGNFDIYSAFQAAMSVESNNIKTSGALINNVFGAGNEYSFKQLAKKFTDAELADMFNDNAKYDFVVCALVPGEGTKTGLQVKQLKMNTKADVATARMLDNTAVLPYDMYIEIADAINIAAHPSELNKAINKLMLIYKASALFHPGTWVRNLIDATQKSATDLGNSPLNIFSTFGYELDAINDIQVYEQISKWGSDFIDEANWGMIQQLYHTNMTFDDFELLKGVMESNRYVTKDKKLLQKIAKKQGGRVQISGKNIGLRDLPEKDISRIYDAALANTRHMEDLGLDRKAFLDIYTGKRTARTQKEIDQYEKAFRNISHYLENSKAVADADNLILASFLPFNYTETAVRYAQLKQLGQLGYSNNQALRHVHATQFRSSVQYGIPNKLEYIVPFITFKYNNLKYWMRMMDENPKYFKYFTKLYGNVYDDSFEGQADTGSRFDFASNYMIKTGGIPVGTGQYYFKINPSFFDSLSLMYNLPVDAVSSLNPILKLATRYSMYQMGLDSKYFFQELDLSGKDSDPEYILKTIAPRISQLRDDVKVLISGGKTWDDEPTMNTLYKLIPSLVGKNKTNYDDSDFKDFQADLARQGKWYDCNLGYIVSIDRKNEYGANDPDISWMDRQNYMMTHLHKAWDANVGKFVNIWDVSLGGLNQNFNFDINPDDWDKLCEEYKKKGMTFDYNKKKFVPYSELTSGGLNNPDIDFETRVELMKEKFPNLIWDANQNAFVEREKYIAGGLNDVQSFSDVMLFRYALFGETYDRETHKFNQTEDSKVVTVEPLYQLEDYDNYFAMLGIPRLPNVIKDAHINNDGLLITSDGKYILTSNPDYNQRVFNQIRQEYSDLFSYGGRRYNGFKNYSYKKQSKWNNKKRSIFRFNSQYFTPHSMDVVNNAYQFNYQFKLNYRYRNPQPSAKLRRLVTPRVNYPYGGGYTKYSFYMH